MRPPYPEGRESVRLVGLVAQAADRLADQAGDVHLGDADALADLRLGQVLLEAQAEHLALAVREHAHQALDRGRVLRDAVARVLGADGVGVGVAVLLVFRARPVERDGTVGGGRLARLEHLLERRPGPLADFGRRGRATQLARHLLADAVDLDGQLLEVAGDAHGPALVPEVPLELAQDGRDRERGERGLAGGIEPVDGLQEAERRDLDEVVELLATALVAARELAGERQEALHELLAGGRIVVAVVADQQAAILLCAGGAVLGGGICWYAARAALFRSVVCASHANHHAASTFARRCAGAHAMGRRGAGPDRRRVYREVLMATSNGAATERHLRVLIADEDKDALHALGSVLSELGHEVTPYV